MKYFIFIIVVLIYAAFTNYVFNLIDPWAGIALGVIGFGVLIYLGINKFKNFLKDL